MKSIIYLESEDIENGILKPYVTQDNTKYIILLCMASWCGFCKQMLPAYEKLAMMPHENFVVCALKADGDESEKQAFKDNIKIWDSNFKGFPSVYAFGKDGKIIKPYNGNRDENSLLVFMKSL